MKNILYTRDNLYVLHSLNSQSVDLIYLDPPFNSKRMYSAPIGSKAAGSSFKDMWTWQDVNEAYLETLIDRYPALVRFIQSIQDIHSKAMMAYITYMTQRLIEMHRVLKDTGSLYLHVDPTASHYLKIVLDRIFGRKNFKNEVVWKRTYAHSDPKQFGRNRDTIFFYTKTNQYTFNRVYVGYSEKYKDKNFRNKDNRGIYQGVTLTGAGTNLNDKEWRGWNPKNSGRHWSVPKKIINKLVGKQKAERMSIYERLDLLYDNDYIVFSKNGTPRFKSYLEDLSGTLAQEIWIDINPISSQSKERTGYPTQKPLALLQRIIKASSNAGDVVFDPFCGCATTCVAAQQLDRKWIGIDIEIKASEILIDRLSDDAGLFKNFVHLKENAPLPKRTDIKVEPISASVKEKLFEQQEGLCGGCKEEFNIYNFEIDHIIPKSKGGGDYYENYQLLCGNCNRIKGDRPMEYLRIKIKARESLLSQKFSFGG